jgi:L-lactate dehydrogenase complex protein LldG
MSSRERVLSRLRQAQKEERNEPPQSPGDVAVFSDMPDPQTLKSVFRRKLEDLQGEYKEAQSLQEAAAQLVQILGGFSTGSCLAQDRELVEKLVSVQPSLETCLSHLTIEAMPSKVMAGFEVGITTADYFVARTGTVVLNSKTSGGRRLSVLPPVHIVLGYTRQLVPSLESVFREQPGRWSFSTLISGPSRTADIEKELVLGAHGPKRLVVIMVDETQGSTRSVE